MIAIRAAVRAIVERARKDERLAAGVIVWLVLAVVLSANGAKPEVWGGMLLLAVVGAILGVLIPRRDKER